MLEALKELASTWWLAATGASILLTIGYAIVIFALHHSRVSQAKNQFDPLLNAINGLSECKLDNLKTIESAFRKQAPELVSEVAALESDSRAMYRHMWIPAPESRLAYPEIFPKNVRQALRPGMDFLAVLIGLVLTAAAFILAMVDAESFQLNALIRMICLIPVLAGLFAFLWLRDQHNRNEQALQRIHRSLMQAFERKVPVFTQAGETATVLNRFVDHDQLMTQSVTQLAQRVDKMASGEITEAVSNALKFVLTSSIGPALQKSTDSLSMLSVALEKQMRNSMNTLGDRLVALEFDQKESAKFLQNQYETVTSTLLKQQEMSFTQLRKVQELMLEQITNEQKQTLMMLTENQQRTLGFLTEGQKNSYQTLSTEQQTALQNMTARFEQTVSALLTLSHESQSKLNEQYGSAWTNIRSGIDETLTSMKTYQEQLLTAVQAKQDELATNLQTRHESLTTSLQSSQETLANALTSRQDDLVRSVTQQQESLVTRLQTSQDGLVSNLQSRHENLSTALQTEISQVTKALTERLTELSTTLISQQERLGQVLTTSQSELTETTKGLTETIAESLLTQQEQLGTTLTTSQNQLSSSIQSITADLTKSVQTQQVQLASTMQQRQDELTQSLQSRYNELTHAIQAQQVDLAAAMQARQDEVMAAFIAKQAGLVQSLQTSQETLYAATNNLQEKLSTTFHAQQLAAIAQMQSAQDQTLQKVADYQLKSLNSLTEDVARNLGSYLDQYLEPVSKRLIASADVLVAAQAYADKVQDAFEMQREQVAIVEAGMKEAIQAFVETRSTMMTDLSDLRKSTAVMSSSADKMSAIFAGSESGLSDSIELLSTNMTKLGEDLDRITSGTAKTTKDLQEQIEQSHSLNQRQIEDLSTQINSFSDELATRIEQLTLGFTQVTEELVKNVRSAINEQNNTLTGNLRHLVEVMSEESRSMSLFAQQITMDIDSLSTTLSSSVAGFNQDIRTELSGVLTSFDKDIADVLKRLSVATSELGDAVESLPEALAPLRKS